MKSLIRDTRSRSVRCTKMILACVALTGAFAASAETVAWTGWAGDGKWSSPNNWAGQVLPQGGDSVFSLQDGGATEVDVAFTNASLQINAGTGAFTFGGTGPLTLLANLTDRSAAAQSFAVPLEFGETDGAFAVQANGPLATTGTVRTAVSSLVKTGAGEWATSDGALLGAQDVAVEAGTLRIARRDGLDGARYSPVVIGKNPTLVWRGVRLADVKGAYARPCGKSFTQHWIKYLPFHWRNDGETATVQFQAVQGGYTKGACVTLTQQGDDVYAQTTKVAYGEPAKLGDDMLSGTGWKTSTIAESVTARDYGVCNLRPAFPADDIACVRVEDAVAGPTDTLVWRNVRLADVTGVVGCPCGLSMGSQNDMWQTLRYTTFFWEKNSDGTSATVQFQLLSGLVKGVCATLTQRGEDVYARTTWAGYGNADKFGADMRSGSGWTKNKVVADLASRDYGVYNLRPVFGTDAAHRSDGIVSASEVLVWSNVQLADVMGVVGRPCGSGIVGWQNLSYTSFFWQNNGTTATVQFQTLDSQAKGVCVTLTQRGNDVYGSATKAAYGAADKFGEDMLSGSGWTYCKAANGRELGDYGVYDLIPLMPAKNGKITVANGARLDVAASSSSLADGEATRGKTIYVSGTGVDGNGALYNSEATGASSGYEYGHIVLAGDTRVGGGVQGIRPLDGSADADAVLEGGATLTVACTNFIFSGTQFALRQLDVATRAMFQVDDLSDDRDGTDRNVGGTITNGIHLLADGAVELCVRTAELPSTMPIVAEPGSRATLDVGSNAVNVRGSLALGADALLTVAGDSTSSGLVLLGALSGSGRLSGANVRFGGTASEWRMVADANAFVEKVDVDDVTDADFLVGLRRISVTYTGDMSFKELVIAPAGALAPEQAAQIELSVVNGEGQKVNGCQLAVKGGNLVLLIGDTSVPTVAHWTGLGRANDFTDSANWACTNEFGQVVSNAVPMSVTVVYLDGAAFDCAAGTPLFVCKEIHVACTLTASTDWSGMDFSRMVGGTIDLNGNDFTLGLTGQPVETLTVTDSSESGGTLALVVPKGSSMTNEKVVFAGSLAFVKTGGGTYVSKVSNSYAGGTTVAEGSYWIHNTGDNTKTWAMPTVRHFGALGTTVTVEKGATLDLRGTYGMKCYPVVLSGGTFANTGYAYDKRDDAGIGQLTLTADSLWDQEKNALFHGDGHTVVKMNGHTLAMNIRTGKNYVYLNDFEFDGGIVDVILGGAFSPCGNGLVTTNALLKMSALLTPYGSSDVGDFEVSTPHKNNGAGTAGVQFRIFGTYTPKSTYNNKMVMQDGSAINLAARTTLPFAITSDLSNQTLGFAENAKVQIDVGRKRLHGGDLVLSWAPETRPSTVKFSLKPGGPNHGTLRQTDAGLEYHTGLFVIICK